VEFFGREAGGFEEAGEFAAAGDDGGGVGQVFEDGAAAGGHAEVLMDIGALGDGDERDAAIGEVDCGAGVGVNPGAKEDVRPEVAEGLLEGMAQGGGHEQVVYGATDLWEVGGAHPARVEWGVLGTG